MADIREVMGAEHAADAAAQRAVDSNDPAFATVHMLNAIRLEIRAQGMRFDYSITEASKQ